MPDGRDVCLCPQSLDLLLSFGTLFDVFLPLGAILRGDQWLAELRRALKENDYTADFLDRSKHFVLPTEDAVIEVPRAEGQARAESSER